MKQSNPAFFHSTSRSGLGLFHAAGTTTIGWRQTASRLLILAVLATSVSAYPLWAKSEGESPKASSFDENVDTMDLDPFGWAHEWLEAAEISLHINSDPVMRAVVCRVPLVNFTLDAMMTATGLSRERLVLALNMLTNMGLVAWEPNAQGDHVIRPASDEAREAMLSWADYWCVGDDQCGVGK